MPAGSGAGAGPPRTSNTRAEPCARTAAKRRPADIRAASMSARQEFEIVARDAAVIAGQIAQHFGLRSKAKLAQQLRVRLDAVGRRGPAAAAPASARARSALARAASSTLSASRKRRAARIEIAAAHGQPQQAKRHDDHADPRQGASPHEYYIGRRGRQKKGAGSTTARGDRGLAADFPRPQKKSPSELEGLRRWVVGRLSALGHGCRRRRRRSRNHRTRGIGRDDRSVRTGLRRRKRRRQIAGGGGGADAPDGPPNCAVRLMKTDRPR